MAITKTTNLGDISITSEAIAALAGGLTTECYGVVGMASQKLIRDGWAELLGNENFAKGDNVTATEEGLKIDLYIIVSFGVRISSVVSEIHKKLKYELEKNLQQDVIAINVFVQGVRTVE